MQEQGKETQVNSQMASLCSKLSELEGVSEHLRNQLVSVIRKPDEENKDDKSEPTQEVSPAKVLVPLAHDIRQIKYRIQDQIDIMNLLIERLEL